MGLKVVTVMAVVSNVVMTVVLTVNCCDVFIIKPYETVR